MSQIIRDERERREEEVIRKGQEAGTSRTRNLGVSWALDTELIGHSATLGLNIEDWKF